MTNPTRQGSTAGKTAGDALPAVPAAPKRYDKRVAHYRYSEADVLGEGAYGSVYRAYDERTRDSATTTAAAAASSGTPTELQGCRVVALKQMSNARLEDGLAAATLREIAIVKELAHIVRGDRRDGSVAALGGYATFAGEGAHASTAANGRLPRRLTGDVLDLSLTDQGNTSDTADDGVGWQSSPSPMPSPEFMGPVRRRPCEADVLALISQGRQHVLEMYDVVIDSVSGMVYIALELCEGGDAWHYLRTVPERRIADPRVFRRWVLDMLLGVAFMHGKHISHRDLKPQNIMLKQRKPRGSPLTQAAAAEESGEATARPSGADYMLKIADFGLSRVEDIPVKKYVHEAVTLWYRSPDVILGNTNYGYSVDAWSLGCIIMEIASGAAPFRGQNENDQLKRIFSRLGGPPRCDIPHLMSYPHSAKYAAVLEMMADAHEREQQGGAFAAREAYELSKLLSETRAEPGPAVSTPQPLLEHIASNRAHLRALLQNRGCGMDVLGEHGLDLVARLLIIDPVQRLTVLEAVWHPFAQACLAEAAAVDGEELPLRAGGTATPSSRAASDTAVAGGETVSELVPTPHVQRRPQGGPRHGVAATTSELVGGTANDADAVPAAGVSLPILSGRPQRAGAATARTSASSAVGPTQDPRVPVAGVGGIRQRGSGVLAAVSARTPLGPGGSEAVARRRVSSTSGGDGSMD